MSQLRPVLKPFLRCLAAGMLFVWLAAVTMCSAECSDDHCHCEAMPAATANCQSHNSDQDQDHNDSFCISLHHLCLLSSAIFAKPSLSLAFTLNLVTTSQLVASMRPETLIRGRPPDCNWVFTPEVCLGPALRGLAPPVLV